MENNKIKRVIKPFKMRLNSTFARRRIQEFLFECGYKWINGEDKVLYIGGSNRVKFILFKEGSMRVVTDESTRVLSRTSDEDVFVRYELQEYKFDEFMDLHIDTNVGTTDITIVAPFALQCNITTELKMVNRMLKQCGFKGLYNIDELPVYRRGDFYFDGVRLFDGHPIGTCPTPIGFNQFKDMMYTYVEAKATELDCIQGWGMGGEKFAGAEVQTTASW